MKKYNSKKDEKLANDAFLAMLIIFCVTVIVNYITMWIRLVKDNINVTNKNN